MRTLLLLLCTALLPPPCACAADVGSSIAICTTAADLNALKKKSRLHFSLHKTEFSIIWSGVYKKTGIFRSRPLFLLSRLAVKASNCLDDVYQGMKVLSPDIFEPYVSNFTHPIRANRVTLLTVFGDRAWWNVTSF